MPTDKMGCNEYFMSIAETVNKRADCKGLRVGAVIVKDSRVLSTGYNGTAEGMQNCLEGGCYRCNNRDRFESGTAYDICICVHAEQNALLAAARFGIAVAGSTIYTTNQPCFGCAKELLQAGVKKVYYRILKPVSKKNAEDKRLEEDRIELEKQYMHILGCLKAEKI